MSLRTRLILAVLAVAVVALAVAETATYSALRSFLYDRVDQTLDQAPPGVLQSAEHGQTIPGCGTVIGSGPGRQGADSGPGGTAGTGAGGTAGTGAGGTAGTGAGGTAGTGAGGTAGGPGDGAPDYGLQSEFVEVRTVGGSVAAGQECAAYIGTVAYTPDLPADISGLSAASTPGQMVYLTTGSTHASGPPFRVRASVLADGDELVLAVPLGDTVTTLHQLLWLELVVSGVAIVAALLAAFWLVRLGLRPLTDVERTAEAIASGNLAERVPGEDERTEVGRLARALNVMLGRIESAFAARSAVETQLRASDRHMRQFVADASHELRTPIAAIAAYAELFERGASESEEDLGRVMGGIRGETSRLEHLVVDLLQLARIDEGRPPASAPVELVRLCAEAVQTALTVGPQWPVRIEASHPVEVVADATQLRQVMDNLLGNVRSHTPRGTSAVVRVGEAGSDAVITVTDDGPGLEAGDVERVFERFYRGDPSRSRAHGGSGLGLSIVASIVAAHGGTVHVEFPPGGGTGFTVRLPLAAPGPGVAPTSRVA